MWKFTALLLGLLLTAAASAQVTMTGAGLGKPGGSVLVCSYTPVTTGTQGTAYTGATPTASGGTPAYTFSETGALPTGITISSSTGVLSGTPTGNGTFAGIQVKVTDSTSTVANCGASFTLIISPSGYNGPGDVASGATAWWGLRGYNNSYATPGTNPAVDLVDQNGLNLVTINILSTGALDQASIGTWITAHSVTTPFVSKLYDQTGHGHHLVMAAISTSPKLTIGAVGSYSSVVQFGAGGGKILTATGFAVAQPYTMAGAALFTSNTVAGILLGDSTAASLAFTTAPKLQMASPTALVNTTALSTSTWYAVQGVANGASSSVTANAASTSGSAGATGVTAAHTLGMGNDDFSDILTGSIAEMGIWPSDISSTSPIANIRAYGSF